VFNRVPACHLSLRSNNTTAEVWGELSFLHFYRTEDGCLKEKVHRDRTQNCRISKSTEMIFKSYLAVKSIFLVSLNCFIETTHTTVGIWRWDASGRNGILQLEQNPEA